MTDIKERKRKPRTTDDNPDRASKDRTYLNLTSKSAVSFADSFINSIFTDDIMGQLDLAYTNVQDIAAKLNGVISKYLMFDEPSLAEVQTVIANFAKMCILKKVLAGDNIIGIWDTIESTRSYMDFERKLFLLCKNTITEQFIQSKDTVKGSDLLQPVGATRIYNSLKTELIPEFFMRLSV